MSVIFKEYKILGKKGEGTFSEVLKCLKQSDGKYYACKKMKQHYESWDQVNNLREVQAMRRLSSHANIVALHEVIFDKKNGSLALILELMDMNVYELIRGRKHYLPESKVKNYMWQLCKGIEHIHKVGIFHRDVKPENILIKDDTLKLADFGSCRTIHSKQPYTEYISTRWYRAPECLLTDGYYGYEMDLWSVGCVIYEVMSLRPLFPGANEVDQIAKIHDIVGTPSTEVLKKLKNKSRSISFNFPTKKGAGIDRLLPHAVPEAVDLIKRLCEYDPEKRMEAKMVLKHPYFREYRIKELREKRPSPQPTPRDAPSGLTSVTGGAISEREGSNKENAIVSSRDVPVAKPGRGDAAHMNGDHEMGMNSSQSFPQTLQEQREKDREWRKKRRKANPYHPGAASSVIGGNIVFPRLVNKGAAPSMPSGALLGGPVPHRLYPAAHSLHEMDRKEKKYVQQHKQPGGQQVTYLSGLVPKRHHLPSLFQTNYQQFKAKNKTGHLSLIYGQMPPVDKTAFK